LTIRRTNAGNGKESEREEEGRERDKCINEIRRKGERGQGINIRNCSPLNSIGLFRLGVTILLKLWNYKKMTVWLYSGKLRRVIL
jgi:hypothetical protein